MTQPYAVAEWKREQPATVRGEATAERVAMLRSMFPRLPWVEVYKPRLRDRPDRHGGITLDKIAELRAEQGDYPAMVLELKREYCLIRWRAWLDSHHKGRRVKFGNLKYELGMKARREAKAAAKRADLELRAGEVAEKESRRRAATVRRIAALKAARNDATGWGVPFRGKAGASKRKFRRGPGRPRRSRRLAEAAFG